MTLRQTLAALTLAAAAASAPAQTWDVVFYSTVGAVSYGSMQLTENRSGATVLFTGPDLNSCSTVPLPASVARTATHITITVTPRYRGCDEVRYILPLDGSRGIRQDRVDGTWRTDTRDRRLTMRAPSEGSSPVAAASGHSAPAAAGAAVASPTVAAPSPAATAAPTKPAAAEPPAESPAMAQLRQQVEQLRARLEQTTASAQTAPAAGATPAHSGRALRARALVIGNGSYAQLGKLPNPRNDAEAFAAKLRSFRIDVDVVLDANRQTLVAALNEYQVDAQGYDINILFYAGHALQIAGVNYIAPTDLSATSSVGAVKLNAISLSDALDYLSAPARLVFLDACRDNPLSRSLVATRATAGTGLAPFSAPSGTLIAYATRDGATAEDGNGRHSPYTAALLEHLGASEDIAIVLRRVRQAVMKATSQRQEPWEYGSLVGDALVISRLAP